MPGMSTGFLQLRRGLFEHVKDGRVSFFEASLYVAILSDANPSTGVCYGSAGLFAALYSLSSRTCRDALEKLEEKGYLRRFPTRGKHGSYPILVNKFRCSDGAMKGKYVNCSKSTDWNKVVYDLCDDGVNEGAVASVNEGVNDSAARVDTRDKKQDKKQLPLLDDEHRAVIVEQEMKIYEAYPRKVAPDKAIKAIQKSVERLVEGNSRHPPMDEISARRFLWKKSAEYAASPAGQKSISTEDFRPHPSTWFNQGHYFDDFSEWQKPNGQNGATNGKQTGRIEKNLESGAQAIRDVIEPRANYSSQDNRETYGDDVFSSGGGEQKLFPNNVGATIEGEI
jgi:hypothetical protein